jgi:hypothetical protein
VFEGSGFGSFIKCNENGRVAERSKLPNRLVNPSLRICAQRNGTYAMKC